MTEFTPYPWPETLARLVNRENLTSGEAHGAMSEIMHGRAVPSQIAAFVVALRIKGETTEEMTGLVTAMRELAVGVDIGLPVIDTAGTGGDRSGTFNVSTTAAFIAAGAGAKVAKHGNRSASSLCGSADVLEALGMAVDLPPEASAKMVRDHGFGFFFAPLYHPAMRHAGPIRQELGIPTVFNFLGPLVNPAHARRQAIGVSSAMMAEKMVGVLRNLGTEYAFVYFGSDGLDEITITGPSYIYRLRGGEITHAEFTPEDFGVKRGKIEDLQGGDAATNASILRSVLEGEAGPRRDMSLVNAAPALVAAGIADGFVGAVHLAAESIDSGAAIRVLDSVIESSQKSH